MPLHERLVPPLTKTKITYSLQNLVMTHQHTCSSPCSPRTYDKQESNMDTAALERAIASQPAYQAEEGQSAGEAEEGQSAGEAEEGLSAGKAEEGLSAGGAGESQSAAQDEANQAETGHLSADKAETGVGEFQPGPAVQMDLEQQEQGGDNETEGGIGATTLGSSSSSSNEVRPSW